MTDELKTGEQALAEERRKIEIESLSTEERDAPENQHLFEDGAYIDTGEGTFPISSEDAKKLREFVTLGKPDPSTEAVSKVLTGRPIGWPPEHEFIPAFVGSEAVLSQDDVDRAFRFLTPDELPEGTQVISGSQPPAPEEEPKRNVLGTQDFCPMGLKCNHYGAEYCKQAKLEADHKKDCEASGQRCACFHPGRGIPSVYRGR